jgi:hypothetical protein
LKFTEQPIQNARDAKKHDIADINNFRNFHNRKPSKIFFYIDFCGILLYFESFGLRIGFLVNCGHSGAGITLLYRPPFCLNYSMF